MQECIQMRRNVHELRIICFEYVLLEFKKLLDWIYAPGDEFFHKRAAAISAREKLLAAMQSDQIDYKCIEEIRQYQSELDHMNIEQLAAKLLFDLTRNTGFEVTKGSLGRCWMLSCCEWEKRQKDDICGLDTQRISLSEKMRKTVLNILYNPDKIFCIKECGDNAIDMIYSLDAGQVYSDYPTISFKMDKVQAVCQGTIVIMDDYEDLKEWWNREQ